MKYTNILWDWNGTLLDDVMISIDCVNVLLKKLNKKQNNIKTLSKDGGRITLKNRGYNNPWTFSI